MQNTPGCCASRGFSSAIAARLCPPPHDNVAVAAEFRLWPSGTSSAIPASGKKCKELRMAERRKKTRRKAARKSGRKASPQRWSQRVTRESDALDLERGVFKLTSAKKIAASLKRSAEHSTRRKSGAYRSALSMLIFYINRAGRNLPKPERERLERAKVELKRQFGRE
jgi:hypothetical protein